MEDRKIEERKVTEVVSPNSGVLYPIGKVLPLNNKKGYFVAPAIYGPKGEGIRKAYIKLVELEHDGVGVLDAEYNKAFCGLVSACLRINYNEPTVKTLIDEGLVDLSVQGDLITIITGGSPDYVVVEEGESESTT